MGNTVLSNIFFLLGGIAVMMFGMRTMGSNLEQIAGNNMKKMLGRITNNRFVGVGIGAIVTAIVNSSAATTVMLVGFVNIGLINLVQAASVIMGANIGTTITAQILSLSGSNGLDVAAVASLIAAVGMVFALFIKKDKPKKIGFIMLGVGMIFLGLKIMGIAVNGIIYEDVETSTLKGVFNDVFRGNHNPILLIIIGIIFTALIQSSAAVTGILVALAGALRFETAVFIILGSNIGTCITALISSIGTSTNAKRTAIIHLLFNALGCIICIVPLWIWGEEFSMFMARISGNTARQIANFHTLFNIVTTLILLPFTNGLVFIAKALVPDKVSKQDEKHRLTFIDDRLMETPAIATGNVKNEIIKMSGIARENINFSMLMLLNDKEDKAELIKDNENALNYLSKAITDYLTKLTSKDLSLEDERKVGSYYHVVSDIERVGDYAENIMEYSLRLKSIDLNMSDDAKNELGKILSDVNALFEVAISAFDKRDSSLLSRVDEIESGIDDASVDLESRHIERLKDGICSAEVGSIYLQTVSNLERVADHVTNVAFSIKKYNRTKKTV